MLPSQDRDTCTEKQGMSGIVIASHNKRQKEKKKRGRNKERPKKKRTVIQINGGGWEKKRGREKIDR